MKNLLFLLLTILIGFTSCEKEEYNPWVNVEEPQDTTKWQDNYTASGTLPTNTSTGNKTNGTKWVLTKMVTSFATEYPNDTLEFITDTEYTINGSSPRGYQLSSLPASTNYELSLYYMSTFGGSHYSANVGYYFAEDGEMQNIEFHNIQNTTTTVRAWFKKI